MVCSNPKFWNVAKFPIFGKDHGPYGIHYWTNGTKVMAVEMLYLILHHLLSGFLSVLLYSFLMIKESTTKQKGPKVICLNNIMFMSIS